MIVIVYDVDLNTGCFEYLYLTGISIKLSLLNVELLFSICISIYFNIICMRKYVIKRLLITSVTQVHGLIINNDYNSYD